MLRFNIFQDFICNTFSLFQYILCCGSTNAQLKAMLSVMAFQYILCCGSTSKERKKVPKYKTFQYILCCGSTPLSCLFTSVCAHFNTSYVAVQRFFVEGNKMQMHNFNTSYVAVQPCINLFFHIGKKYFNTSYVAVQLILKIKKMQ